MSLSAIDVLVIALNLVGISAFGIWIGFRRHASTDHYSGVRSAYLKYGSGALEAPETRGGARAVQMGCSDPARHPLSSVNPARQARRMYSMANAECGMQSDATAEAQEVRRPMPVSAVSKASPNRSQSVTGSQKHRDPRYLPYAFTEHGAIVAANVLNSPCFRVPQPAERGSESLG